MSRRKKERGKRLEEAPQATAAAAGPAASGQTGIEGALDVVVAGGELAEVGAAVGGEVLGGALEAVSSGGEVLGGLAEGLGGCLGGCSTLIAFGIVLATAGAAVARALSP